MIVEWIFTTLVAAAGATSRAASATVAASAAAAAPNLLLMLIRFLLVGKPCRATLDGRFRAGPSQSLKVSATEPSADPATGEPALRLAGLRRDYGDRTALDGVGLELAAGESLVVLGPNGAGKTTLLRILATLLRPSGGEVFVLGCSLPREAWKLRGRIGYLGHEPLLYRDLTGRENLRFHARLHGISGAAGEAADRARC